MATAWVKDTASTKPDVWQLARADGSKWVQRKNITEIHRTEKDEETGEEIEITEWESDLRFVSKYEKEKIEFEMDAIDAASSQERIIQNQKTGEDSQLYLMEAMADLYEIIADQ